MDEYRTLEMLADLRAKGAISEEEYQREKAKILNNNNSGFTAMGMGENSYLVFMHLSQFAGYIIPGLGFILPIVLWLINADKSEAVNKHGKNIANFMLSMLIYVVVAIPLCFLIVGFLILGVLFVLEIIFIIIAAVRANNDEYWAYPLTIRFFS
ncbi:MAG: DUF4870 domain-containing protein [Prevotella sp.]|jgi:uncharacterized Tic20 family protein|nr:DUF4870 domain-containing protein [Prevotella sp.]